MKQGIHPTYNEKITVTCSCGNSFDTGSTQDTIKVEVCSNCHPFYTGKQKLVDVAGRVDKFKKRQQEAADIQEKAKASKKSKKSVEKRQLTDKEKAEILQIN